MELAGTLEVYWDRTDEDLAFFGVLDAVGAPIPSSAASSRWRRGP